MNRSLLSVLYIRWDDYYRRMELRNLMAEKIDKLLESEGITLIQRTSFLNPILEQISQNVKRNPLGKWASIC